MTTKECRKMIAKIEGKIRDIDRFVYDNSVLIEDRTDEQHKKLKEVKKIRKKLLHMKKGLYSLVGDEKEIGRIIARNKEIKRYTQLGEMLKT